MSYNSFSIFVVSLLAIGLSAYSVYVESKAEEDENYEPLCDINPKISCTKVFTSEYGKGFGLSILPDALKLPNGLYGIVFYSLIALLSFTKNLTLVKFQLFLSAMSIVMSLYLGYVLYFILHDVCVVCITTYILNIISVILVSKKFNQLRGAKTTKLI